MEAIAIEIGLSIGVQAIKITYQNRKEIKNYISKHIYKMSDTESIIDINDQINDQIFDTIPDEKVSINLDDEYKSDDSNHEQLDEK